MITKEIGDLVLKVLGPNGRFESMEQQVKKLTEAKTGDTADAMKKAAAMLSGGHDGATMVSGWAGGASNSQWTPYGRRAKTVGMGDGTNKAGSFGDWLTWVAAGSSNSADKWLPQHLPAFAGCRDRNKVDKAMKEYGSRMGWQGVEKAANAEGSGVTGGFLVPPQFYSTLLQHVAEKAFLKALCKTMPMQGRELRFPFLNQQGTTGSGASNFPASNWFGGVFSSWEPEASTYPQTNPGFKMGELVARDLVSITIASNQLIQDSAIALDSMLTTLLSDALAWQLDYAFLRGNGVNQPLGILNAPGTIASARAGSNNLLTSLSDMIGRAMNVGFEWDNFVWIINQSVLPYLIRLTNAATNSPFLVFLNPAPNTGTPMANPWPATLFGRPVYITEKLPVYTTQGDIALIDASKYLCGDRMAIQIEASQFPYFTSNQMVWRTIWRGDGQPWFDAATTLADTSTTVSPHIILAT